MDLKIEVTRNHPSSFISNACEDIIVLRHGLYGDKLLEYLYLHRLNCLHVFETGSPIPLYDVYKTKYENKQQLKNK